ncbi:hypothetical protein [Salinigranum salinum]|uniref:hypothetical protein n=1 Tax=Salinigranum salinum TaxID=1364937 RepID=UPI0012610D47|nr:hypothetical protein [Salinigranum salinum]
MTTTAGLLVVIGFLVAAVGAVPLAAAAFLLARRIRPFSRALVYASGGVAALALALVGVVATISPAAGVTVAIVATVLGVVLWAVPLTVARWVLVRRGSEPERALRDATVGLPVALLASLPVVFGDFTRYNITFLTGAEALLAWTALALVVLFGPAAVGVAVASVRG